MTYVYETTNGVSKLRVMKRLNGKNCKMHLGRETQKPSELQLRQCRKLGLLLRRGFGKPINYNFATVYKYNFMTPDIRKWNSKRKYIRLLVTH